MTFTFDAAAHQYRLGGALIPSVTRLMEFAGLADYSWCLPEHKERGTAVHLACQYDDEGTLDEAALDEAIIPYLEGWRAFRRENQMDILEMERQRWGVLDGQRFAGTLDRLVTWRKTRMVVDIKSGAFREKEAAIQTAAYSHLAECVGRIVVVLPGNGTYRLHVLPVRDRRIDLRRFAAALSNWYYMSPGK